MRAGAGAAPPRPGPPAGGRRAAVASQVDRIWAVSAVTMTAADAISVATGETPSGTMTMAPAVEGVPALYVWIAPETVPRPVACTSMSRPWTSFRLLMVSDGG